MGWREGMIYGESSVERRGSSVEESLRKAELTVGRRRLNESEEALLIRGGKKRWRIQ